MDYKRDRITLECDSSNGARYKLDETLKILKFVGVGGLSQMSDFVDSGSEFRGFCHFWDMNH